MKQLKKCWTCPLNCRTCNAFGPKEDVLHQWDYIYWQLKVRSDKIGLLVWRKHVTVAEFEFEPSFDVLSKVNILGHKTPVEQTMLIYVQAHIVQFRLVCMTRSAFQLSVAPHRRYDTSPLKWIYTFHVVFSVQKHQTLFSHQYFCTNELKAPNWFNVSLSSVKLPL